MNGARTDASGADAPRLVLASGSPRRRELLRRIGLDPVVDPADVPEVPSPDESPRDYVARLARDKATAVAMRHPGALVLAGDTTVVRDDRILEKPEDAADAVRMLRALSGGEHEVLTALALASDGGMHVRVDRTVVRFRTLSDREIEAYVATGEPMDKAGAYGIQGIGGALVAEIRGDYGTVVGLSLPGVIALLADAGWGWTPEGLHPLD